jgi:hypothetical protein
MHGSPSPVREWFIDAGTFLPLRVLNGGSGVLAIDFTHTRVNRPIEEAEFRPESGPDAPAAKPDVLPDGYTRRFLSVNDGGSGRLSVHWGMNGPKGSSTGGVN